MTNEKASVIIGNIPVYGDECYSIAEYQEAKAMSIQALLQEPKTGHWIECEDEVKVYCSECKEISDYPTNYCPNCGAKMVEPQESEGEQA